MNAIWQEALKLDFLSLNLDLTFTFYGNWDKLFKFTVTQLPHMWKGQFLPKENVVGIQ